MVGEMSLSKYFLKETKDNSLFCLMSEHVLVGVMVDLGAHCFPPAATSDEGGAIWGLVSPFLGNLGPSSCF